MEKLWDLPEKKEPTTRNCPILRSLCQGACCQLWDRRNGDCGLKHPLKTVSG